VSLTFSGTLAISERKQVKKKSWVEGKEERKEKKKERREETKSRKERKIEEKI